MHSLTRSRIVAAVVALSLLATACGSDPTEVIVGVADDDTSLDEASDDIAVAEDSSPVVVPSTDPPAPPPTTTIYGVPETTVPKTRPAFEILGPTMIGVGDWARIVDPNESDNDDIECGSSSRLAYVVDDRVVHEYTELGAFSGIRLFNGSRGQDAFVINCEEFIERVLVQGSATMPEQGWPELAEITLASDANPVWMGYLDFAWRGDTFTGLGTNMLDSSGGPELYIFDSYEARVVPLGSRVGKRVTLADHGVDILLPTGWALRDGSTVHHEDSLSHVQIERLEQSPGEPLAEGDELLSSDSADVNLWIRSDGVETTINGRVEATEWTFLSENGVRVVRNVPVADEMVVIELFSDSLDGAIDQDLPWLILDTLRVFEE